MFLHTVHRLLGRPSAINERLDADSSLDLWTGSTEPDSLGEPLVFILGTSGLYHLFPPTFPDPTQYLYTDKSRQVLSAFSAWGIVRLS